MNKYKSRWWMEDKPHGAISIELKGLENVYNLQRTNQLRSIKHYGNRFYEAALSGNYVPTSTKSKLKSKNPLVINLIKNICDTMVGKITKASSKIVVLPKKNDPKAEREAKALEKWITGQWKELNVNEEMRDAWRLATITGNGFLIPYFDPSKGDTGELCVEPILPTEIFYPPEASLYGKPQTAYRIKTMDKFQLAAMYPEYEAEILGALGKKESYSNSAVIEEDVVQVRESWRLAGPDLPEGKYALTIDGASLEVDDYPYDYFPWVQLSYLKPPVGVWSMGIAELIRSVQIELNMLMLTVSENQRLMGRPKWFVPVGSHVPAHMFTNRIDIVEYTPTAGGAPTMQVGNPTPPEVYNQIDRLTQIAYQKVGLSIMSATSQKEPGLNSGVAIQSALDVESERFIELSQNFEEAKRQIALRLVDLAKRHYKKEDARILKVVEKDSFEAIAWNDLMTDDDNHMIDMQTSSSLPDTKAGKMQFALDLVQLGVISDPIQLADILEFPGQEKIYESVLGDRKLAKDYILRLTNEDEEYVSPDPLENHEIIYGVIAAYYKSQRFSNLSEEVKGNLRRHLEERLSIIKTMEEEAKQQALALAAAMPQPAPGPAMPGALPTAAPTAQPMPGIIPE
tara:strand:- start:3961 stop:5838 length:1878 start_codon:yes stop_codon:yes gene_type:complete